jgi:hypothetical protein
MKKEKEGERTCKARHALRREVYSARALKPWVGAERLPRDLKQIAGGSPPCLRQSRQVYAVPRARAGSIPGSGIREMSLEERYARVREQGDQSLRGRCQSETREASPSRTTRQIDHVPDVQSLANFAQLRASGRE